MSDVLQKHCVPCEKDTVPLFKPRAEELMKEIPSWSLSADAKKISKKFTFKDFVDAMQFANEITSIAEAEGHHPDLWIGWGRVEIELSTHSIGGLSENDFILAAKIDQLT